MLKTFYNAQIERAKKIKNPLSFLDWVTMGMVSGAWQGMQQRTYKMLENPSVYNVGNWLTMGLLDTAKGAINPDEPLSLEHWLNSAELAGMVVGGYEFGKNSGVNSITTKNVPKKSILDEGETQNYYEPIYSAQGNLDLRAKRRALYDELYKNGFEIDGVYYTLNEHAYNSMFKSGRKDIMPDDIFDAVKGKRIQGQPGSIKYINETTGTRVFVNIQTNEIVGIWPSDFKE
ncbi:MAG: hypothetical protein IKW59_05430 [Clostridia bacterium]|nr:hypothetical protein [Clostridia bacterium]